MIQRLGLGVQCGSCLFLPLTIGHSFTGNGNMVSNEMVGQNRKSPNSLQM